MARSSRVGLVVGLVWVVVAAMSGCESATTSSTPAPPARPNVLLVTMDTTRADRCSVYGFEPDTTPALRALARSGVRFERAYAASSTTAPTHASLFTGLSPLRHGVVGNGLALAPTAVTLTERLADAGWDTAAIVSSFVLHERFGLAQGFAHYDDEFDPVGGSMRGHRWGKFEIEDGFDRRADATTARAIRWLDERRAPERPFFLFVHYFDPHEPYDPPEPHRSRFADGPKPSHGARYLAEIAFTDEQIGRLLAALEARGHAADTLVIVTADHGEGLGQHGYAYHGAHVHEEAVRVPLLVRWPGGPAGRSVAEPVETIDLAPTILELTGLGASADDAPLPGRSLAGLLRGDDLRLDPEHPVFLFRRWYRRPDRKGAYRAAGRQLGVRVGRWKYIEGQAERRFELFDLEADPGELENLYRRHPEQARDLAARLAAWQQANTGPGPTPGRVPADARERLEALGYVE